MAKGGLLGAFPDNKEPVSERPTETGLAGALAETTKSCDPHLNGR